MAETQIVFLAGGLSVLERHNYDESDLAQMRQQARQLANLFQRSVHIAEINDIDVILPDEEVIANQGQ